MAGCKKAAVSSQSPLDSAYRNPLIDSKHRSEGGSRGGGIPLGTHIRRNLVIVGDDKENAVPNVKPGKMDPVGKENSAPGDETKPILKGASLGNSQMKGTLLKQSSLQLCMKRHEPDSSIGLKIWDSFDSEKSNSVNVWDHSDSEAAPASSWTTLPNRSLMCRPLPLDVGRCTCIIVKESSPNGFDGGTLYTLYTNEGKGRQNRKLAVARHRRRRGRSEFTIAQNAKGIVAASDESLIGTMSANIVGSKYLIWDQGHNHMNGMTRHPKLLGQHNHMNGMTRHPKLLASVKFIPTVSTWTGHYRSMRAWIPKHQSMQLKNTNQIQHMNGLPVEWEDNKDRVHQLFSKLPSYNKLMKQYELDFRDKGRAGLMIVSSVKNFQLTLERNGKQTILQLGKVGKSKYVMDYRYPMTGYQAFCMCLASIDSKPCCTV